ncbi:MAG: hypothetical protein HF982_02365 [Desulfobacteraceae bacterium]|nr:hypothetical protein [Desulfobacteraceae bacterium]MBC2718434.1 hypothetical protein [Desulfobacteraceae bacterium]
MALLSKNRLSKMMLEILLKLPPGITNPKDNIVLRLGTIAFMLTTREINAAWNETKKKAARLYPDKYILDGRNVLHFNDGTVKILDKKISGKNFKKLNELAEQKQCSVDQLVSKFIAMYKKKHNKK